MIEDMNSIEAKRVLTTLYQENPALRELISSTVERILGEIDWLEISEELFVALESVDVSDVWDNAGGDDFGYTDPIDAASDLAEEEILPFRQEMRRYLKLNRRDLARRYCYGMLHGLYRFAQESESEFKEYADDSLRCHFNSVLREWRKGNPDDQDEMSRFLEKHCSRWVR
jgi:hypothetical protein